MRTLQKTTEPAVSLPASKILPKNSSSVRSGILCHAFVPFTLPDFCTLLSQNVSQNSEQIIHVGIVAGSQLMLPRSVRCNPYCTVSFGGENRQTYVLSNTVDPQWSERFSFQRGLDTGECTVIAFAVFNRINASQDDCLGTVDLDVRKIRDLGGGVVDDWFALKPPSTSTTAHSDEIGSIKLRVSLAPTKSRQ